MILKEGFSSMIPAQPLRFEPARYKVSLRQVCPTWPYLEDDFADFVGFLCLIMSNKIHSFVKERSVVLIKPFSRGRITLSASLIFRSAVSGLRVQLRSVLVQCRCTCRAFDVPEDRINLVVASVFELWENSSLSEPLLRDGCLRKSFEGYANSAIINTRSPTSTLAAGNAVKYPPFSHSRICTADRFIVPRSKYGIDAANYLLTKQGPTKEKTDDKIDVFKEVDMVHVKWRKDLMHRAMVQENVIPGLGQKEVLRQSRLSSENKLPGIPATQSTESWNEDYCKEGMWKSRPRKRPLISDAGLVIDMMTPANRNTRFLRNRIDWSSKNLIAQATLGKLTLFEVTQPKLTISNEINNLNSESICALKWNNAGDLLIICTLLSKIKLYDSRLNKIVWLTTCNKLGIRCLPFTCYARCLCWSPDDKLIAVFHMKKKNDHRRKHNLETSKDGVSSFQTSPKRTSFDFFSTNLSQFKFLGSDNRGSPVLLIRRKLVSCDIHRGCLQLITIYCAKTGFEVNSIVAHSEKVLSIAISWSSRYIVSTSSDKQIRIFTWPALLPVFDISYHYPATELAWNPMDSNMLCIGGGLSDASLSLWDMTTMDILSYRTVDFFGGIENLAWNKCSGELVVHWSCIDEECEQTIIPVFASLDHVVDTIPVARDVQVHALLWNADHSQLGVYNDECLSVWNFFGDEYQYRRTSKKQRELKESKKNTEQQYFRSILQHHTIR
ncbi:uncharacterized protein LOC143358818 [Halictus rubicundus]|uniref:uncharacterized protein LOC143358818 n=1 Tax=Halictus rubicundus TaxID=77578 RepID=UPI0040364EA1